LKIDIINKITALNEDFELGKEVFRLSKSQKLRIEETQQEVQYTEILTGKQTYKDIEEWL